MFGSRRLTYGDFSRTGTQDCHNAISYDDFDYDQGKTAKQIVAEAVAEWEADGLEEQWLSQQDDFEGLDPHKCYEAWKGAWMQCAEGYVDRELKRRAAEADEENPPPKWWHRPSPKPRACYRTKADALKAFLDTNSDIVENYGGADYEVSPAEFDAVNHKYDLKGKRAARSIADAVWHAMPVGRPFCLDRIDIDALNDTSPAREAGVAFRLPDINYELQAQAEEAAHYAQQDEPEPAWVTERVLPPIPSMEDIVPVQLQLVDREPGVETYSINPSKQYNEFIAETKGKRAKHGYNVIALDPATGVGQDGDTVRTLRDAVAWARKIADGKGAYRGGRTVAMSAIVTAGYDEGAKPTVYSVSPPGYPVWRKEQAATPAEIKPMRLQLEEREPGVETYSIHSNPAWVTKIVAKHYEALEDEVPPKWLPKLTQPRVTGGKFVAAMKEYGCGAYGCVLPTLDPGVVLKLTTDDTEAEFAHDMANKLTAPVVVKYHLTRALPDRYRGRDAFLLWRDSAEMVGDVVVAVSERGGDGIEAENAIWKQHRAAQKAFDALHKGRPAEKLIREWEVAAREMGEKVPELRELAEGMITNLHKNKVFMGDVHSGNIGRVNNRWVVVDPGHVAVLT